MHSGKFRSVLTGDVVNLEYAGDGWYMMLRGEVGEVEYLTADNVKHMIDSDLWVKES